MHGAQLMAKRTGRKRLYGIERRNDGKAKPPYETPHGEIRRLRDAALAGMRHPEWGTVCGMLFLQGKINAEGYAAAKLYDRARADYTEAICTPGAVKSGNMQVGIVSHPPDPDSAEGREVANRDSRAVTRFYSAQEALKSAGKMAEATVIATLGGDYPVGHEILHALNRGLSALAAHYRLTNHRNREQD